MRTRRSLLLAPLLLAFVSHLLAAEPAAPKSPGATAASPKAPAPTPYAQILGPIRLWDGDAPGALGQRPQDIPTLTPFPANKARDTGATMLIFPGGGYSGLAEHEGTGYAEFFAAHGITAYVLKYRLGSAGYRHPVMLGDAARALRLVRSFARRDGRDPNRIGVIGSSAGGHLASTLVTHFDAGKSDATDPVERESSRPDLGILCYAVITMGEFTHAGSKRNLLGTEPDPELVKLLSNELQVTKDTPPCFLWHTVEDKAVPVENSLQFAAALRRAGGLPSLHIYEKGSHGLGLGRPEKPAPPWSEQLLYWFKERKFTP
ncbi:MAG: prolyl oligopeptidase family serine peptidase [Verrucomicrobia bacterium]|nr:prolyl oligopeptidase family serine peptidase [Verrucomicrobiota bacterium]